RRRVAPGRSARWPRGRPRRPQPPAPRRGRDPAPASTPACYAEGMLVGLISDTHGLLRPEALAALAGVELILHAGDVGAPTVLRGLARIAPVRAVRGNNDKGGWAARLPHTDVVEAAGARAFILHDLHDLAI